MKKNRGLQLTTHANKAEHEIPKAVAQAWFTRHNNSNPSIDELDVRRRSFHSRPSQFLTEAIEKKKEKEVKRSDSYWDFKQSLWDPYEIVAVSKRLEEGLVLGNSGFQGFCLEKEGNKQVAGKSKNKESRHSLRGLINTVSSRRFHHPFLCS